MQDTRKGKEAEEEENQLALSVKRARPQIFKPLSTADSDSESDGNDDDEEGCSPGQRQQQRQSPEILRSFDHTSMDSYINKFAQRQRQGQGPSGCRKEEVMSWGRS